MFDVPGAYGIFDKVEVYDCLGSTLLESTAGHGHLMTLLMQMSTSFAEFDNFWGANAGTRAGYIRPQIAAKTKISNPYLGTTYGNSVVAGTVEPVGYTTVAPTTGEVLWDTASLTPITATREYCIPIPSFLGLLSNKFAPLHNGYTIVLTLNQQATAFGVSFTGAKNDYYLNGGQTDAAVTYFKSPTAATAGNSPNYVYATGLTNTQATGFSVTYDNVYYCCQVLELGPQAEELLLSSTGQNPLVVVVPTKAYRNHVGTVNSGSSMFRLDLNLNVASLTNILWFMRNASILTTDNKRSLSERIRNLQSWYFQYGSSILPQTSGIQTRAKNVTNQPGYTMAGAPGNQAGPTKMITDHTEGFVELMKSRHLFNEPNHPTTLNTRDFISDDDTLVTTVALSGGAAPNMPRNTLAFDNPEAPGAFACGLDLELVSGRSNDLVCGMNTNGISTSIYAHFDPTKTANVL